MENRFFLTLLRFQFGEAVEFVGSCLLVNGAQTLQQVLDYTQIRHQLDPALVRNALTVLIQHDLVTVTATFASPKKEINLTKNPILPSGDEDRADEEGSDDENKKKPKKGARSKKPKTKSTEKKVDARKRKRIIPEDEIEDTTLQEKKR